MQRSVEISVGAVVFLCLMCYVNPYGILLPFLLAAFCHEMGHILVAVFCGGKIKRFRLTLTGAELEADFVSNRAEIAAILAGSLTNLLLFIAFSNSLQTFAYINLALACYNLLPILPLDGGRVLELLLLNVLNRRKIMSTIFYVTIAVLIFLSLAASTWFQNGYPLIFCAILILKISFTN